MSIIDTIDDSRTSSRLHPKELDVVDAKDAVEAVFVRKALK
jgi:hypothetical protein